MPGTRKPSLLWYVLAAALVLAGPAVILWGILGHAGQLIDLPTEFTVPGSTTCHVDQPGTYKVFLMTDSVATGKYRSSVGRKPEGLVVEVVKPDGTRPRLSHDTSETFSFGSKSGESLFAFEAIQPGDYTVKGVVEGESAGGPIVLGVGKGFSFRAFGRMMLTGILGGLCSLAGIAIAAVTFIRWLAARGSSTGPTAPPPVPIPPPVPPARG